MSIPSENTYHMLTERSIDMEDYLKVFSNDNTIIAHESESKSDAINSYLVVMDTKITQDANAIKYNVSNYM